MAALTFEDAYLTPCVHCGSEIEWEWEAEDLLFKSTCSCARSFSLMPVNAVVNIVDRMDELDEPMDD